MSLGLALKLANATLFKGVGVLRFTDALPPSVTYGRTGAGTALTSAGDVVAFATDVPRITDRGMLLEADAATNLNPYSADDPSWAAYGSTPPTVSGDVTTDGVRCVSATFAAGLDGYEVTRASGSTFPIVNGDRYAASYRMKLSRALTGAESILLYVTGSAGGWHVDFNSANSPTTFTRFSAVTVASATGPDTFTIFPLTSLSSPVTVFVGERQFEVGAAATSLIDTAGSEATRGAENASLTVPTGRTIARATYGLSNTVVDVTGLTPGSTFDLVTGRAWLGLGNELKTLEWRP